jgi:hypothetical protein
MRRWGLALVCAGCGLPEVTVEGAHVRVAADAGLELCGGTLSHMDAFIAAAAAEFGVAAPTGGDRFTYYWVDEEDYYARTGCSYPSGGCARGREAFSYQAPLNHEFVHNLARDFGRAPPFFAEGLATAFEGLGAYDVWDGGEGAVWETLEAEESRDVDYLVAGAFVRFLVERHGVADVLRVIDELPRRASAGRVDRALRELLNVSLEESVAAFEAARAACPGRVWTAMLLECAAPTVAWDGEWLAEHRELACAQEDVIGPYSGDTAIVFRTVAVERGGWFDVAAISEGGGVWVTLAPCGGGCGGATWAWSNSEATRAFLEPGLYSVRLMGPALREVSVGWSMLRAD